MNLLAVVKTGGKQYKVTEGDILEVEKVKEKTNNDFYLNEVLLVRNKNHLILGQPLVKGARVRAKLLEELKTPKIRVVKFKSKSRYLKIRGHRQEKMHIQIEKIEFKK